MKNIYYLNMSTIIKPLELIVDGTKVYPDVDLSILGSPLATSSTFIQMNTTANNILAQHNSNISGVLNSGVIVVPDIEDGDDSPFHTNSDPTANYWTISGYGIAAYITEIQPELDAKWLSCAIYNGEVGTFRETHIKSVTFKQGSVVPAFTAYYDNTQTIGYKTYHCGEMFGWCSDLEEVHNLNLTDTAVLNDLTNESDVHNVISGVDAARPDWTYAQMFIDCHNLRVLDVVWPTYLYGGMFGGMFAGCSSLPENQLPELKFRPLGVTIGGIAYNTIDLSEVFNGCSNFTSLHIDNDTWQYVTLVRNTWNDTQIKQIDIPATATNLIDVNFVIGQPQILDDSDYSAHKYIIRTEAPMNNYLIEGDGSKVQLFDYGVYDDDQDFINGFGGIYVPDNQLSDWTNVIADSAPNIAANCVHGLSEL